MENINLPLAHNYLTIYYKISHASFNKMQMYYTYLILRVYF